MRRRMWLQLALLASLAASVPAGAQPRWETYLHRGRTWCLAPQGDILWAGSSGGIRVYDSRGGVPQGRDLAARDGLGNVGVSALEPVPGGLWAGSVVGTVGYLELETNRWERFGPQSGLPRAPVTALVHDGQELWAATAGGGVARLNQLRRDWEVWDRAEGLPDEQVLCLVADAGGLWAGTASGLVRYLRETFRWEAVQPREGLTGAVRDLAQVGDDLWIASDSDGLSRIALRSGEYLRYQLDGFGVKSVYQVTVTAAGELWVATDRGLLVAPEGAAGEAPWRLIERPLAEVAGLVESGDSLWVGGSDGLWQFTPATGEWANRTAPEALPSGELTAGVMQANYGWFGFADRGLARLDLGGRQWETLAPPPGSPRLLRDLAVRDNQVYCACWDGLAVFDQRTNLWTTLLSRFQEDLLDDRWTAVEVTGDRVWCAGPGKVSVFTLELELITTFRFPTVTGNREGTLPDLRVDESTGDIWLLTRGGAWRYQPRQNVWGEFAADYFLPATPGAYQRAGRLIQDLAFDAESVWFVGLDRVIQYRKQQNQLVYWDESSAPGLRQPQRIAADRYGVWLAGELGLSEYQRQTDSWLLHPWPTEIGAAGEVTAVAADSEEPYVWVATAQGLVRLELAAEGPRWRAFPAETGAVAEVHKIVVGTYAIGFLGRDGVTIYRRGALER